MAPFEPPFDPTALVAAALQLPSRSVAVVVGLLDDGNTVPFIARYRKEATGNLDEVAIANIEEARKAALALQARRVTILTAIEAQGALTDALRAKIVAASDRETLEDLYLPYKAKRKTRASVARARGLEPLAQRILDQAPGGDPLREAARFLRPAEGDDAGVPDAEAALAGARDIVAETLAEHAGIRATVRTLTMRHGGVMSTAIAKAVAGKRTAYEDYYDFGEAITRVPSHRYLAICRGEAEGLLRVAIDVDAERMAAHIETAARLQQRSPWAGQLREAVADGYKRLIAPSIANELRAQVRERAELEATEVFAENLGNLLLAAPFGRKAVVGVDPGFRTGCKCAALTDTGRFVGHTTVYPHTGGAGAAEAAKVFAAFVARHGAAAVAVGNGTAGRETMDFARDALAGTGVLVVAVSESGASIYSASEIARAEFPDLDLTVRGAISIGRRLQDPLAELVKVDPQSLGVGQYQHDITASLLKARLERVVERCVHKVGVELNTASAALLQHVAGIGPVTAARIVEHRDLHGAFTARAQLLQVKGIGPKAFEQAAGFVRIRGAANPLDDSAVHPEREGVVAQMAKDLGVPLRRLVGDATLARSIDLARYADVGRLTLDDIIAELCKPGLDPRQSFEAPAFRADLHELADVRADMVLEGVVTNVAAFGAFVDVGVHQDGLVHVSRLADRFVKDPFEVVAVGQKVRVRVLEVDVARKRLSLSMRDV